MIKKNDFVDGKIPRIFYQGMSYSAGLANPNRPDNWKGFGGRHFTVKFNDGRILKTDDLVMGFSTDEPDNAKIFSSWAPCNFPCEWQKSNGSWAFVP